MLSSGNTRRCLGRIVMLLLLIALPCLGQSPKKERILRKKAVVNASLDQVWDAWTTSEGIASFFSPESNIELRIGGPYELYLTNAEPDASGKRGTQGCKVLSYIPKEMLSFEWNFPPKVMNLRKSDAKTQVVLRFEELKDGRVGIRFAQLGWKEGEDWDAGYAYFDQAWDWVLNQLKEKANAGALPAVKGHDKPAETETWTADKVSVTAVRGPEKRQDFEMTLPVPVKEVWGALATTEGFRKYLAPKAEIELRPGGAYAIWPGATNRVLSYWPQRMLSTSGSAPPQFPNVRKGGTWSAYFFKKLDKKTTKLRLTVVGWQEGEEWDRAYDYFLKNNPVFLNHLYAKLTAGGAGHTKSSEGEKGILRQVVEVEASVDEVWAAFTTKEGIESWMAPLGAIDLKVGGKMRTSYDRNAKLGDDSTIESTIIALEPKQLLSLKLTKPPEGFPFPNAVAKTWAEFRFEKIAPNRTKLTIIGYGYTESEESRKMRDHFRAGNDWTLKQLQKKFAR